MIPIHIDLSDKVQEFNFTREEADSMATYVLDRIVDEYMQKWESVVNSSLQSSRDEYKRAMYSDRPEDKVAIIGLSGRDSKLAMMIETGASFFDMKRGFSQSSKKTVKKNGKWYLTIPFRHGSSDAIMDEMVPGTGVSVIDLLKQGETLKQETLPVGYQDIKENKIELAGTPIITYKHKSPIHEGLHRRAMNSTLKEKRGGYLTFRRVSDESDEESWTHPGIQAYDMMSKALDQMQLFEVIDNSVQDFLETKFG